MANVDIKIQLEAAKATAQMERFRAATEKARQSVEQGALKTQILNEKLKQSQAASQKATQGFSKMNLAIGSFIGNLASNAVTAGFNALRNGARNAAQDFLDFEVALVAAGKTSGFNAKETEELGKAITELSRTTPLTTKELLRFSEIGGQLGLKGVDQVEAFTDTFAKLSVATNIAGEESAIAFTKILGLTDELGQDAPENIAKLGSVITALGNDVKALETDIVSVSVEVSKGLIPFKLSSAEIAAYGATLAESGVAAEAAGSSMQIAFSTIAKATEEGGKQLEGFANLLGQTPEQFKKVFQDDPEAQFNALVKALGNSGLSAGELLITLESLGINQKRTQRSLLPLIENYATLEKNLKTANGETSEASALNQEAAKAFNTTAANIQELNNQWNEITRIVINAVLPAFSNLLISINDLFTFIRNDGVPALEAVGIALGTVGTAALFTSGGFAALKVAAIAAWAAVTAPVTLVIAAVAAVAAAIFIVRKNWNSLIDAGRKWLGLAPIVRKANEDNAAALKKLGEGAKGTTEEIKKLGEEDSKNVTDAQANQAARNLIANNRVENKKKVAQAARDAAAEESRIREEQLEAERAFAEMENQRYVFSTMQFDEFNQGRLSKLREFFTLKEQIEAEAHLMTIENETERQAARLQLETEGQKRQLDARIKYHQNIAKADAEIDKIILEAAKHKQQEEQRLRQMTIQQTGNMFGALASLAQQGGKKQFELYKALATAQVVMNGITQVSNAAALPYPANIPAVIFAVADSAARVASIQSQSPRFEQGGIVGGSSFTGDRVQARVNSGEMILNRQQQSQLFNLANGGGRAQGAQTIQSNITVELDGEVVGRAVSTQVANGLQLGEVV